MTVDILITLLIVVIFVIACKIIFGKGSKEESEKIKFSYQSLCDNTKKQINDIVGTSVAGMGLSKKEAYNQEQQQIAISSYIRTCCSGDSGSREAMKELIRSILIWNLGVNEKTILYAIPFNATHRMTARQMFESMLYKLDEKNRDSGFKHLCDEYNWGSPHDYEDYLEYDITDENVRAVWIDLGLKLNYADQLNVLVQMIYSDCFGLGVIDTLNQQVGSIEEIQIGLCGLPEKAYHYRDEIMGVEDENKQTSDYSKDSVHVLVKGSCIRLKFLSFETDDELQRVIRNLIKNSGAGELTVINPEIVIETIDGRRISTSRPPISDSWVGFIRKFDAIQVTDVNNWCKDMGDCGEVVANTVSQMVKGGFNIGVTGEMSAGKTTFTRGLLLETRYNQSIRIVESESLELNARRFLHGRNAMALRVTDTTPEEDVLAFIRKTSGQVFVVGEVNSAAMANLATNLAKISQQLIFSAHYITTEDMIADFTNAKLCVGGYSNEKMAEMDSVRALRFDIHLAKHNGIRYVQRINEIIPYFDHSAEYDTEEISGDNAEVKVASGLREVRKQLGKMNSYKIRPIMEYDAEEKKLTLLNKPSEMSYREAKSYMTKKQYDEFVEFFECF